MTSDTDHDARCMDGSQEVEQTSAKASLDVFIDIGFDGILQRDDTMNEDAMCASEPEEPLAIPSP